MRDDRERFLDILESIERIEKYTAQGRRTFEENELIQTWVIHHLQIIGEAARSISEDFKEAHPGIPWSSMIGMRNILVHAYFGIDLEVTWSVIERDLPDLKAKIELIIDSYR